MTPLLIDELVLEAALRHAGALQPNLALSPTLKAQLIRAAQMLTAHLNLALATQLAQIPQASNQPLPKQFASSPPELVMEAPDTEESIHRWISNAPELAKLRMYYLLYLNGARIDGIEGKILKEERKLKGQRG
jgi:hypothetical protein